MCGPGNTTSRAVQIFIAYHIVISLVSAQSVREHVSRAFVPSSLGSKNLFIEAEAVSNCRDINIRSQFYRTNTSLERLYACVSETTNNKPRRILVTGGAGFVGSHLVDSLMLDGHQVIVCDNFYTGRRANIEHWLNHNKFELLEQDVADQKMLSLNLSVDQIYHLAAPASPAHYMVEPLKTIDTIVAGTMNLLKVAKEQNARIVLASTSEIYGDPLVHPQREDYWGNTNPIGPRSCYDESKRMAETIAMANHKRHNVSIGIARIFNTYGPRMNPDDGRVISNFVTQAMLHKDITIYGSGNQTRSFQYISDLVRGLRLLMAADSNTTGPINLGNPAEISILDLAKQIKLTLPSSRSTLSNQDLPVDDPLRRRPDIHKARESLHWEPRVSLTSGLERTIDYFVQDLRS